MRFTGKVDYLNFERKNRATQLKTHMRIKQNGIINDNDNFKDWKKQAY